MAACAMLSDLFIFRANQITSVRSKDKHILFFLKTFLLARRTMTDPAKPCGQATPETDERPVAVFYPFAHPMLYAYELLYKVMVSK
jgi:hypothetical protein